VADVFISYSRKNSDFVHKLDNALIKLKREVWVDWEDIARGEDWWHSIQTGIDSADTALIIITEPWLLSEICHRELDYIRQQNKRVFPIIRERIEGDLAIRVKGTWVDQEWEQRARDNWKYLRSLNWIYFDDDTTFDTVLKDLVTALDTDQLYVKSHTRYLVRALEWQQFKRNPSFLLEGDQLASAKQWLDSSANKHPEPHPAHHEYITAGKVAETARLARDKAREQLVRRFRQMAVILGILVVIAIIAAGVVGQQFLTARAEVTKAGATLQQVNLQVTDAIQQQAVAVAQANAAQNLVATATVEQGRAVAAQRTSFARENIASTKVAVAGATLSPVPPTLTAVASAINDSKAQQDIALGLANAGMSLVNQDYTGAGRIMDNVVAQYPQQAFAYVGRGMVLDALNSPDTAIADFTKAIELDPQSADGYYNRGVAYKHRMQPGDLEKAKADYEQTIKIDPRYTFAFYNLGNIYRDNSEFDKAIEAYTQLLKVDDTFASAYFNRAVIYAYLGKIPGASADFFSWVEQNRIGDPEIQTVTPNQLPYTTTVKMTIGHVYGFAFDAKAGQRLQAKATAAGGTTVDPLLILLDGNDTPIFFSSDISSNDLNSAITDYQLPSDENYILVVSYEASGSEGDIQVSLDLSDAPEATPELTPTLTASS
jgi:tetratricopeptide (TPR) repeat protein